jgi:RsiW-degrading membrane proteinase PrsW (M82 family)
VSSDYQRPDPNQQERKPTSELWGPWGPAGEDGPQYGAVPGTQFKKPTAPGTSREPDPQFIHREHVSGSLPSYPSEAPLFRPAYPAYQTQNPGYQPYPGYPSYSPPPGYPPMAAPPYSPYNPYKGYPWQPPQPKRDGYLFGVAISSVVGSILLVLAGLGCLGLLMLFAVIPTTTKLSQSDYFAGIMLFISLAIAGIVGGGFALYHSIRSAFLQKPSADFSMPQFWIFILLYLVVIGAAYALQTQGLAVAYPPLTAVLIVLAGIFPALAVLALGVRRLHFPRSSRWPTSWRRFTLALVSGATLSIGLAAVLELAFQLLLVRGQAVNPLLCIDQPNVSSNCQNPGLYNILLVLVAVIAPLIEETVKPLAVVILIGRVRSAAEAFVLGLACGIGFDLIETTGYISAGYQDWLNTALIRTGSGLLHGFGAAMVALGWYYLTHPGRHRWLKASGCWLYAVAQHALWNGSWGLVLLPAPVGPFFNNLNATIGSVSLPYYELINIGEVLVMLVFFIYITGRLRTKVTPPAALPEKREAWGDSRLVLPT